MQSIYCICHHSYCQQSTTQSICNKSLGTFSLPSCCVKLNGDGTAVAAFSFVKTFGTIALTIPHGSLISQKIFKTHLASFLHCNRSIPPPPPPIGDCSLTVHCSGASERSNCILPWQRKRPYPYSKFLLGHWCSDFSSGRKSQNSSGILSLWANQLINQNPPSQQEIAILTPTCTKPLINESFQLCASSPIHTLLWVSAPLEQPSWDGKSNCTC